jgi:hypothetical protein
MTQSKDNDTFTISTEPLVCTSDETITINIGDYTVDTIDTSNITLTQPTYSMADSAYTLSSSIDDLVSIDGITFDRVMFEDHMPDPDRIKNMCEKYPALSKAYENFKTIYKMVEQDYKGNYEEDDELPF